MVLVLGSGRKWAERAGFAQEDMTGRNCWLLDEMAWRTEWISFFRLNMAVEGSSVTRDRGERE